jgi:hypothetical protein
MPRRRVKRTSKGPRGDITQLCGDWGSVRKSMAIAEIEAGINEYYVAESGNPVNVVAFLSNRRKFLRTTTDLKDPDHLHNLPDC